MPKLRLRDLARTPYERVLIHQVLFGKAIPFKDHKGKFSWTLSKPTYNGKAVRHGKICYLYDGILAKWRGGERFLLPGVTVAKGLYQVPEDLAKKIQKVLRDKKLIPW